MKDCKRVRDLLSPYLEKELETAELEEVRRHLQKCVECRAELELLKLTVTTLRGLPELPAPAGILRGVREGLGTRPWYRRVPSLLMPPRWGRVPLGALASVLVAFGIFLVYERHPEIGKVPVVAPPAEERVSLAERKVAETTLPDRDEPGTLPAEEVEVPPSAPPEDGYAFEREGGGRAAADRRDEVEENLATDRLGSDAPVEPVPSTPGPAMEMRPEAAPAPAPAPRELPAPPAEGPGVAPATPPFDSAPGPAPRPVARPVAPPPAPSPPPPPPAPEPVLPPPLPMEMVAGEEASEAAREKGAVEFRERREEAPGGYREGVRGIPPPARALRKREPAGGRTAAEGVASFASPADDLRSKSLPAAPAKDDSVVGLLSGRSATGEGAVPERESLQVRPDVTEVLTVISLGNGEVDRLRERLRRAGGRMLELRALDAFTSQQLAQPHRKQIPPNQVVSQGWRIRAAVPRSSVNDFVASFRGESSLQLLHRTTEPLSWSQERGLQNFEINLIR